MCVGYDMLYETMLSIDVSKLFNDTINYFPEVSLLTDMICVNGYAKLLASKFVLCEDVETFLMVS